MTDPVDPYGPVYPPGERVLVSLAMIGAFVAVLIALSYPLPVAAALAGAGGALVLRRATGAVRTRGRICLPGTDRCLHTRPSR